MVPHGRLRAAPHRAKSKTPTSLVSVGAPSIPSATFIFVGEPSKVLPFCQRSCTIIERLGCKSCSAKLQLFLRFGETMSVYFSVANRERPSCLGTTGERSCLSASSHDRQHARGNGSMRKRRGWLGLSRSAAYECHNRYEQDGIEGLRGRPRPGRRRDERFNERILAGAALERGLRAFRGIDGQRILKV